ncbi:ABC transporter permease [Brevibacterium sp. CS2]|uniref:ABC transporter permease n=1 Tax=Brevibacterium sp. CS2 TaxID=2575923 RepID=UPI0010C7C1AC|nr:ABC transporter permease [Brevibacterium sp. CS2]QCP04801.1 ABC transporter permease [Brevibacterium sp. CS2]
MIAVRTLLSRPTAAVALAVLILVAVVTALGSVLAPSDPLAQDTSQVLAAPSAAHWLGTDYLGRDILSRLLAGTRLSVLAALEAVVIALLLGTVSAVASVFAPRGIRWVLERVFDSFMALPFITFAVAIGALLGNSIHAAMVAVGILASPTFFRVVRAVVIEIAHTQYVDAARLFGVPIPKLVLAHVVPRIVPARCRAASGKESR